MIFLFLFTLYNTGVFERTIWLKKKKILKNNKSSKITVKLVDQIPVSNDKSIDVELVESSEAKFNKNKGMLTWLIDLEPNTSKTKIFTYIVKYPEGERIIGL